MRPMRLMKVVLAAGMIALVTGSAGANTYTSAVDVVRGATLAGEIQLSTGDTASFTLDAIELERAEAQGALRVVPAPTQQQLPTEGTQSDTRGCVTLNAGKFGKDRGCTVTGPATIQSDPVTGEVGIVLTFFSDVFEGAKIEVVFVMQEDGVPEPVVEGDAPVIDQDGQTFSVDNAILAQRSATVLGGKIRSEGLGGLGGPVAVMDEAATFSGIAFDFDGDYSCLANVALVLGGCSN